MIPLRTRMSTQVTLSIPGFEGSGREVQVLQAAFRTMASESWYGDTRTLLLNKLGQGYFPVFRLSDGECYFCLGYRLPPPGQGKSAVLHYGRTALSAYVKYGCYRTFWSGQPGYGHEVYRGRQWRSLRSEFANLLREVAERGLIAANFSRHRGFELMSRYIPDIYDWFDKEGIRLDSDNYIPFYFVYALLLGPDRHAFLRDRKVLVITSLSDEKERRLRKYFEEEGSRSVNFIRISRSSSMTDRIELRPEHEGTEIVLIGAGVGAANILHQVKSLGTLAIDAGYVLECYQNPAYKGTRVFTMPDEDLKDAGQALSTPAYTAK
jgi:hypothetical protein